MMSPDEFFDPRQPTADFVPADTPKSQPETVRVSHLEPSTELRPSTVPPTLAEAPAIPGYRITAEIARGGMGRIYAAIDETLDREVAIKTLLPGADAERFVTEAKITAKLPHPAIPPVHALGTLSDGTPWLAMKLIHGWTLASLLRDRRADALRSPSEEDEASDQRKLPGADLPRFIQIFEQIAQAVGFAHSRGIIHRDLKPLNVMVGEFGEVQVMDWGLAKDLHPEAVDKSSPSTPLPEREGQWGEGDETGDQRTRPGTIMGTPGYMAPEQARGEVVDQRADVFALGSILATILTGQPAFVGKSKLETIQNAAKAELSEVFNRLDACGADAELIALCKRCLSANREDRPANGQIVANEIAAYRAGVEARLRQAETDRARAETQAAEQAKRRRVWIGLTASLLVGFVASLALAAWAIRAEQIAATELDAKQEALEAETAARNREKLAREQAMAALDTLTDDLVENQIARGPFLTEENKALLRKIIERYEKFAAITGEDAESRMIRATGYARVGMMQYRLGGVQAAEKAYRSAISLYDELITEFPDNLDAWQGLGTTYSLLSVLLRDLGEFNAAEAACHQGIAVFKRLAEKSRNRDDHADKLASSYSNLGVILMNANRVQEAEEFWTNALYIRQQLAKDYPRRLDYSIDLARIYANLGNLHAALGRHDKAESAMLTGLEIINHLIKQYPSDPNARFDLAKINNNYAAFKVATNHQEEAESYSRFSVLVLRELVGEYPSRPEYMHELIKCLNNLAIILIERNQFLEAESAYREALDVSNRLSHRFPSIKEFHLAIAEMCYNYANLLRDMGRLEDAESQFVHSLTIHERFLSQDVPSEVMRKRALCQWEYASLLRAMGRIQQSESAYVNALSIQRALVTKHPQALDLLEELVSLLVNIAELCNDQEQYMRAFDYLAEARSHMQGLLRADSENAQYRQTYRDYLAAQTVTYAGLCEAAKATANAQAIRDLLWDPPYDAYGAAVTLCRCCAIVEKHARLEAAEKQTAGQFYADHAMAMLRDAVSKGFRDAKRLRQDPVLAPLRDRQDFQALLTELEKEPPR